MLGGVEDRRLERSCSPTAATFREQVSGANRLHREPGCVGTDEIRQSRSQRAEVVDPAPSQQVWKHLRAGEPAMDHECEAEDAPAAVEGRPALPPTWSECQCVLKPVRARPAPGRGSRPGRCQTRCRPGLAGDRPTRRSWSWGRGGAGTPASRAGPGQPWLLVQPAHRAAQRALWGFGRKGSQSFPRSRSCTGGLSETLRARSRRRAPQRARR